MSWRFRKSVKIAPGVRLNVGKKSVGLSAGPRGAKVSVNSRGQMGRSVGIPGTGVSHRTQTQLFDGRGRLDPQAIAELPPEEQALLDPEVLRWATVRLLRRGIGWGSVLLFLILVLAGAPTVAGYLVIPMILATWLAPKFLPGLLDRRQLAAAPSPVVPTGADFDPRQIDRACPNCDASMIADSAVCHRCGVTSRPWILQDGTWWDQPEPGLWIRLDPITGRWGPT